MQVSGPRHNKTRAVLVVSEITLAVILLVGSALLIRTFVALYSVDRGFDATNVLTMRMKMTGARFQDAKFQKAAVVADTMRDGLERLRALPGVESGTASYFIPLQTAIAVNFDIAGRSAADNPVAGWAPVAPGYFDVFRIPVKRGRAFNDRDDSAALPVVIISESMAKAYWGEADPLGDRIVIGRGRPQFREEPVRQIVGVVGDIRDRQLYQRPVPAMYVPQAQITDAMNAFLVRIQPVAWMVRARDQPRPSIPAIREQLRQATGLPVTEVRSMDQVVSASAARQRFNMLLMSVFGSAALLLAAIGVYGLMAYAVEQRTREIGIRLALGAEASRVRQRVVFEGMRLALAGVVIGIGAAWELSRFLASFLYGVPARDPTVFIAVPTVLSVVALLAVWVPATRASRIDPLKALRYE
jgi:predicted permease